MEKNLCLTIRLLDDETFEVEFFESETWDFNHLTFHDSGCVSHEEWQKENNKLAAEIRFWAESMREHEREDAC